MDQSPRPDLASALLDTIETDILPLTRRGVAGGDKVFGAALLRKSDLSLVLAETNHETANPLWHGEVHAIKRFHELPAESRPPAADLVFLSTHEPCSMCLSAIAWAGFDNFHFLFSHQDSRDGFAIPHDLDILKEVFRLAPGGYRRSNRYWTGVSIPDLVAASPDAERLRRQADRIRAEYAALSALYQRGKEGSLIPLP